MNNKKAQVFLIIILIIAIILVAFFLVKIKNEHKKKCTPNCLGKECGSDDCVGSCGDCFSDERCQNGNCINNQSQPNNQTNQTQNQTRCINECNSGEKICINSSSYKICGNYDSDECLEFSSSLSCSSDEICQNGICINNQSQPNNQTNQTQPNQTRTIEATPPTNITINERRFIFSNPESNSPLPVIIVLHGKTQYADVWFDYSTHQGSFTQLALSQGYAVIAPDSTGYSVDKGWNFNASNTEKLEEELDFFDNIFDWIENRNDLDFNRIYVAGISSGGFMTSRLALTYQSKLKAVDVNSAGDADKAGLDESVPTNIPSAHPPTLIIHGKKDIIVPIIMGRNYYTALKDNNMESKMIEVDCGIGTSHLICHDWFSEYNQDILDWFEKY